MNAFPHSIDIAPGILLFVVSDKMDVDTTHKIGRFVHLVDDMDLASIVEIIPSYGSILVIYDVSISSDRDIVSTLMRMWEMANQAGDKTERDSVTIDVVYGDVCGEDLPIVSDVTNKPIEEVITLHASGDYTVGAVGFAPGFAYLIGLTAQLATPRKSTPRLRVPAGSVGIGGNQTGTYTLPSAGGWNLIGRSPTRLFDPSADPPVRLKLGDSVRFQQIESADFSHLEPAATGPKGNGPIEVVTPGMQTTVQDLGRYGVARFGFATDGAADRASLVAANRVVGNPWGTAALEITHVGPTLRFHQRLRFGLAGADLGARLNGRRLVMGRRFETMPGDELDFHPSAMYSGARTYLSVEGGFDIPLVMGSASTNLTAAIGGWHGRALMGGDRLAVGQAEIPDRVFTPGMGPSANAADQSPFRVTPGPQRDRFDDATWDRLLESEFHVSADANRVGLRLQGPSLAPMNGADMLSEGIVTGSIQVTGEGQAIVMLPAHATIGGYTKLATVIPEDWDRLGQLSPGDTIRFMSVD